MKENTKFGISVVIVIIFIIAMYFGLKASVSVPPDMSGSPANTMTSPTDDSSMPSDGDQSMQGDTSSGTASVIGDVVYQCSANQSIHAVFMDDNTVSLTLSDGRSMTLSPSADGTSYSNADGSFVFSDAGGSVSIQENGTTTYDNCVTAAQAGDGTTVGSPAGNSTAGDQDPTINLNEMNASNDTTSQQQ